LVRDFPQDPDVIRVLLSYALLVLRVLPALFRSQSGQAIVELVLRQQLATYADKRARPREEQLRYGHLPDTKRERKLAR
jgi:hypothetical protein